MAYTITQPVLTTKIKDAPGIFLGNWSALEDWTHIQHASLASATSGQHLPGRCAVTMVADTATIAALSTVACALAYDTDTKLLKYCNGATWIEMGGLIPSGTKMLFYQDTAPTGWVLQELDDKLVFITKGSSEGGQTGGGVHSDGTWTISGWGGTTDSYALTIADMPAHTHSYTIVGITYYFCTLAVQNNFSTVVSYATGSAGGGGGHTHNIDAASLTHDGTWRPAALNCIICIKD